jgi:hypothetical protein
LGRAPMPLRDAAVPLAPVAVVSPRFGVHPRRRIGGTTWPWARECSTYSLSGAGARRIAAPRTGSVPQGISARRPSFCGSRLGSRPSPGGAVSIGGGPLPDWGAALPADRRNTTPSTGSDCTFAACWAVMACRADRLDTEKPSNGKGFRLLEALEKKLKKCSAMRDRSCRSPPGRGAIGGPLRAGPGVDVSAVGEGRDRG